MDLDTLAKDMLNTETGYKNCLEYITKKIVELDKFFLLTSGGARDKQEESLPKPKYIDDNGRLLVFLSENEATYYAGLYGYDIMIVDKDALINVLKHAEYINKLKVFSLPPLSITLLPDDFMSNSIQIIKNDDCEHKEFIGVEAVKAALNTYETNARRKLDPGGRYENIHTLINYLILQNQINYEDIDKSLEIVSGYTRNFCTKLTDGYPTMELVKSFLAYFGLQEYLYIYKSNCLEMINYLKNHKTIDKYILKSASGKFERFELIKIVQGHDEQGAYVYELILKSTKRKEVMVVSNPFGCVIGREYRIDGLAGTEFTGENMKHELPNEAEMMAVLESLESKEKAKKYKTPYPPSYEEERKNKIIRYFREGGADGRESNDKYNVLEQESDILDEFYRYIKTKRFGKLEILGYTANKLVRELHYNPYEAYAILIQLRNKPKDTKQMLKYRECDPQYQKPPKEEKGE